MVTKETITVTKTIEVNHPVQLRFLPGDQRFVLWYGLVLNQLTPCCTCGGRVQSVRTRDGREWMLRHHVSATEVAAVTEMALAMGDVEMDDDYFQIKNPWCPSGLENAWHECALKRFSRHAKKDD